MVVIRSDVIGENPQRFQVEALAAGKKDSKPGKQIEKFKPKVVAVSTKESALKLREALKPESRVKIFYPRRRLKRNCFISFGRHCYFRHIRFRRFNTNTCGN